MSPWRRDRAPAPVIGLARNQLAWVRGAALSSVALDRVQDAAGELRAGVLDVVAAPDIAVHWLQSPPARLASLDELRRVAAVRCAQLHGGPVERWWVTGDWHARRPFVCAALPRAAVQAVHEPLQGRGIRLRWHTAWGLVCARRAALFPDDGWSGLRTASRLVMWHCTRGRVDFIRSIAIDAAGARGAVEAQALELIQVESLRAEALPAGRLHLLDLAGAAPAASDGGIEAVALEQGGTFDAGEGEAAVAARLGAVLRGAAA